MKIHLKSLASGAVIGAIAILSVAAATRKPAVPEIAGLRFVILDITRDGEPIGGKERAVLRLARFYGKMDSESLAFRLKHETQELKLVTTLDVDSTIRTNDIIGLQAYEHTKLSPGSRVVTHLPAAAEKK
jgi:hypothetical protein